MANDWIENIFNSVLCKQLCLRWERELLRVKGFIMSVVSDQAKHCWKKGYIKFRQAAIVQFTMSHSSKYFPNQMSVQRLITQKDIHYIVKLGTFLREQLYTWMLKVSRAQCVCHKQASIKQYKEILNCRKLKRAFGFFFNTCNSEYSQIVKM